MSDLHAGIGALSDERTVILDKPVPLPPGRVRVTVEPLPGERPDGDLLSKLIGIRQKLFANGYAFLTKEKIGAQIQAKRSTWEN